MSGERVLSGPKVAPSCLLASPWVILWLGVLEVPFLGTLVPFTVVFLHNLITSQKGTSTFSIRLNIRIQHINCEVYKHPDCSDPKTQYSKNQRLISCSRCIYSGLTAALCCGTSFYPNHGSMRGRGLSCLSGVTSHLPNTDVS